MADYLVPTLLGVQSDLLGCPHQEAAMRARQREPAGRFSFRISSPMLHAARRRSWRRGDGTPIRQYPDRVCRAPAACRPASVVLRPRPRLRACMWSADHHNSIWSTCLNRLSGKSFGFAVSVQHSACRLLHRKSRCSPPLRSDVECFRIFVACSCPNSHGEMIAIYLGRTRHAGVRRPFLPCTRQTQCP
jgi:hypothetical protein